MAAGEGTKRVPIKEGLFRLAADTEGGVLVGSRCRKCQEVFFPKRAVCARCFSEDMEELPLAQRGRIVSYTVARTGFPGSAVTPPFLTGVVELPEGLRLVTLITGVDFDRVKIGDEVDLYFWNAGRDDQGNELVAFGFRPPSR